MPRDPVCNMWLEGNDKLKFSLTCGEKVYSFCSIGCLAEFLRHPEDYSKKGTHTEERTADVSFPVLQRA